MPVYAASIMNPNVVTAGPDDTVATVARLLTDNKISAVPICDKDGTLLGMLSEGDLMRPFVEAANTRRAWWLNVLAEGHDLAPEFVNYLRQDHRRARDLMTTPVITATEGTRLAEIAELLTSHHIKRVPILRDGKVVGIVSRADVINAVANRPEAVNEQA